MNQRSSCRANGHVTIVLFIIRQVPYHDDLLPGISCFLNGGFLSMLGLCDFIIIIIIIG